MPEIEVDYFPVWNRYLGLFEELNVSREDAGALFFAMMQYQFRGEIFEELSEKAKVIWAFIYRDLDHARKKYEANVNNGKKGGRKKTQEPDPAPEAEPNETQPNPGKPNETQPNPGKPNRTQHNPTKGKSESISESISVSTSITESISNTDQPDPAKPEGSVSKKIYGEFGWIKLSDDEYQELERTLGSDILKRCITYIDESAQSTNNRNKWFDWFVVLRRCAQLRWYEARPKYPQKPDIPHGASGELGEAELEAIQWILQQD